MPEETWQFQILEDIALRAPLGSTLTKLVLMLESLLPGSRASVLTLEGNRLRLAAAPSLPPVYNEAVDGLEIGPLAGSCGTAAYTGQPVLVEDIEHDPRWADFRDLALGFGLRACWSMPILAHGKVLGTFALYRFQPSSPDEATLKLVQRAQYLACLALQSDRAVRDLEESEARFRTFVDNAKDGMFLQGHEGLVLDVNGRACEMLGYSAEELVGMKPVDFDPDYQSGKLSVPLESLHSGQEVIFETRHRRADGTFIPVEVRMRAFQEEGRMFTLSSLSDITERKQSEAALERQRQLLLETQQLAGLGYFEVNLSTGVVTWSEALYRVYGQDPATFRPSLESFLALLHPDDREITHQAIQRALSENSSFHHLERIIRPGGEVRVLESHGKVELDSQGQPIYLIGACLDVTERVSSEVTLRRAHKIAGLVSWSYEIGSDTFHLLPEGKLTTTEWLKLVHPQDRSMVEAEWEHLRLHGTPNELEYRIVDNRGVRWFRVNAEVRRDGSGKIEEISGITQDITHRRKLEDQLRESQKMEAVGRLAGGVAHDFNNLLTVIQGYTAILEADPDEETTQEGLEAIRTASEKASSLTAQLLAFSRRTIVEPQILDINSLIHRSSALIKSLAGAQVEVQLSLDLQPCVLRIDPTQFEQMLINLVVNARDAMTQGGKLLVRTRRVENEVVISVGDNGKGIQQELLDLIFEPFFTTKEIGAGTGLGLAVVHGVVTGWGGRIEVDSLADQGTTFRIYFPAVLDQAPTAVARANPASLRGRERILLVEDEEHVRGVTRLALEKCGYQVQAVGRASQALEMDLNQVDLVITDVIMPEMGGVELGQILRSRYPQLPILFVSGYTDDRLLPQNLQPGLEAFLHKPFTPAGLAGKVRTLLDS